MPTRPLAVPVILAAVAGLLLWCVAAALTRRPEPWDSAAYWAVVYPVSIAACAGLGFRFPSRPWRWALVLFEAQFVAMALRKGELGNLWPLGMVLFAVIAVPGMAAAALAARRSRRAEA